MNTGEVNRAFWLVARLFFFFSLEDQRPNFRTSPIYGLFIHSALLSLFLLFWNSGKSLELVGSPVWSSSLMHGRQKEQKKDLSLSKWSFCVLCLQFSSLPSAPAAFPCDQRLRKCHLWLLLVFSRAVSSDPHFLQAARAEQFYS